MKMIDGISEFWRLPLNDKWLTLRIFVQSIIISILIEIIPFRWIAGKIGTHMHETTFEVAPENEAYSIWVGKLVAKVANHTPWTIKCLTQSIVTKNLLRKSNIEATLYLGIKKHKDKPIAHAWLRVGSHIVNGKKGHKHFTVVSFFGG